MACEQIALPGGGSAIVCGGRRSQRCRCGRTATLLCDWKLAGDPHGRTCDAPLCDRCTTSPAPEKDLCPKHAAAFEAWKVERGIGGHH